MELTVFMRGAMVFALSTGEQRLPFPDGVSVTFTLWSFRLESSWSEGETH